MIRSFIEYANSFFDYAGRKAIIAYILVFAGALLDGVGLFMLVPFLEVFSGINQSGYANHISSVFEYFGTESKEAQLLLTLSGFLLLLFLRNLIMWLRETRVRALSQGFVDQWRIKIIASIAAASWPKVMEYQRTDLEHAINSDVARLSSGTDNILRGSIVIVMMTVQIAIALVLSPILTIIILSFIILSGILLLPTIQRAQNLGQFTTKTGRRIHEVLGQFMSGLKLAKAHKAEQTYVDDFEKTIRASRSHALQFASDQTLLKSIFQFASGIVVCLVIFIGLFFLEISMPILIVVLVIMGRLTGPFLTLVQGAQSFANLAPAYESLQRIVTSLNADAQSTKLMNASNVEMQPTGPPEIEFDRVSFSHGVSAKPALDDVSFKILSGEITALIGPSGAGKTTLVDLLIGLLQPVSGDVLVGGRGLTDINKTAFSLAYVPQDPFLFDLSLRENLLWPEIKLADSENDLKIWKALEFVGAAKFVRATPGQLEARAGERGQAFSGGERQRLCLARALLRQPSILILDEATNAVDQALELELLDRLNALKGEMTVLFITHRQETVFNVDHILSIKSGKITSKRLK